MAHEANITPTDRELTRAERRMLGRAFAPVDAATLAWHCTAEARAVLADCVANPPAYITRTLASHERWSVDDETVSFYDKNDDRVDALHLMSERACEAAMRACGDDRDTLHKLIHSWPHVDHVIGKALAAGSRRMAA